MSADTSSDYQSSPKPWPLILCLVGVDYFSTLAYLPSIAVQAAGPFAPLAAGGVVIVTFLLALPLYWYIAGRAPDGRGAAGLLEDRIRGWRGKLVVLTLLGFAAADFVITRSLSLADAAVHVIHNPHGQAALRELPTRLAAQEFQQWPVTALVRQLSDPQIAVTVALSLLSFGLWQLLRRGPTRHALLLMAGAVIFYLALTALIVISGLSYLATHGELVRDWIEVMGDVGQVSNGGPTSDHAWLWAWLGLAVWSFPQMALGLSGFEMIMTVVPSVRASGQDPADAAGRIRNTRKLLLVAASTMAVYLVSAVAVTTLLAPHAELVAGGAAEHRALSYIAHGSALAGNMDGREVSSLFGSEFGTLYDASTVLILCLAGATVTMGLQNLLPHYLSRLGMEVSWAGRVGVVLHVLNAVVLIVTVIFRASPSSQQWAYATSVLVLLAGAAAAVAVDLTARSRGAIRTLGAAASTVGAGFFLVMTLLTLFINHSGLTIAAAFVAAILASSIVSRWIRSTELRFEGFSFADAPSLARWTELCKSGPKVLVPHRPGLMPLSEKSRILQLDYRLDPSTHVIFIEAALGDPSNFYQKPLMKIEWEEELEVIRVSQCVSVSHVLAAIGLELCRDGGCPPEIIFGWSHESPLAANLNFLLLGEGNIPWMVKELVRNAAARVDREPRIIVG
jgi:hypothetical protein